tara:strand:+ start:3439 stop:4923 length:1485 start_codon:yes stop_codon:yes gene_type:complete
MAKGRKSKTPKRSFGALKKSNEKKAAERNKQPKANEKRDKKDPPKEEMSLAAAKSKALQNQGRTTDLFGNELDYVKVLNQNDIDYNDIKEIRKYGNRPDLAARAFYGNILNKGIASNPLDQDLVKRMLGYEVPEGINSFTRIGEGDRELYGNPLKDVPFLSSIGEAIPNTRNKIAGYAADAVVGFPGFTSMTRGIMDKIAGGSGDYTSAQRYFKNYFPDDQAKVNQLALASLDPQFQRDVFEDPVYAASQNYDGALSGAGGGIPSLASNVPPSSAQSYDVGNQSSVANEGGMDSLLVQIAKENQNNYSPYSFQDLLQNATADLNTSAVPNLDPRVNFNTRLGTFGVSPRGFDYNNQGAMLDDKFNLGANVNPLDQSYNVGFNSYLPNNIGLSGGYSSGQDGGIMASKFLPSDFPGTNGFALSGGANITNDGRFDPTFGIATQIDPLQMLGLGGGLELPVTVDARGTYRNGRFDPSINFSLPFGNNYDGLGYLFK